jgi:protein TonB
VVDEFQKRIAGNEGPAQGGLLLGGVPRNGVTEITRLQWVQTFDPDVIQEALAHSRHKVVGFFRVTHDGELVLGADDLYLASGYFQDPNSVFLVARTKASGSADACFFFWDNGRIQGDFALMEIPLDRHQLAVAEQQRQRNLASRPELVTALPRALPNTRPKPAWWWLALLVVLFVALGGAAGYFYSRRQPASPVAATPPPPVRIAAEPRSSLGFSAERRGGDLMLSWNREAPQIVNATFGMLLIRGPEVNRDMPLNPEQLRTGSVLYTPTTDQMEIQLNVVEKERVTRDSVIVLLAQKESVRAPISARTAPAAEPSRERSVPESGTTVRIPPKPFKGIQVTRGGASSNPTIGSEPPPAIAAERGRTVDFSILPFEPVAPPNSPAPSTAPVQSAAPTPSPVPAAAVPTYKPVPVVPEQLKAILTSPRVVQVKLELTATGEVKKATVIPSKGSIPTLDEAALRAAKEWRFRPASINGRAVPGEAIVQFRFSPR